MILNVLDHYVAETALGVLSIRLSGLGGNAGGSKYEISLPTTAGWPTPFKPIADASGNGALGGDLSGTLPADTADNNNNVVASNGMVDVTYQVDTSPAMQGPHTFNAKISAGPHGDLKPLTAHTVHITAAHNSGTLELVDSRGSRFVRASSDTDVGNLRFRYSPGGYKPAGALTISIPEDWTRARTDNPADGSDEPGEITASPKSRVEVASDGASFTVHATEAWMERDTIVITYKKVKTVNTDGETRSNPFTATARSFGDTETSSALAASPIVGIGRDPDGSGSIALSVTESDTATAIGTLMITYTASGKMEIGSVVEVTVPDTGNWPDPTSAANLSISNASTASLLATAATETEQATMSATTSSELGKDDTIVFVYKNIGAQPAGTHRFTATSTVTYDGTPTPLSTGPAEITVDPVVPGSVALTYVKDEMMHPLTNAAPGADLGQITFTFRSRGADGERIAGTNFHPEWLVASFPRQYRGG